MLIGVWSDGRIVGQEVADTTLRDIAAILGRFEPPAPIALSRVDLDGGRQVIVLEAAPARQYAPFVFEARPYKRVGSTTTLMSQEEYARLLLDRNHSRHRWENQPAVAVRLEDLDREEILRTRQTAIEQRRLSVGTSMDLGDVLDRLGLRIDGQITQAAQLAAALPHHGCWRGASGEGEAVTTEKTLQNPYSSISQRASWSYSTTSSSLVRSDKA